MNGNYANNAEYFYAPIRIVDAFGKFLKCRRECMPETTYNMAKFCANSVSTAFWYDIGEIIKVNINGVSKFAKVVGYDNCDYGDIFNYLVYEYKGMQMRCKVIADRRDEHKAEIPPELLDLAKREILEGVKCPLKGGSDV